MNDEPPTLRRDETARGRIELPETPWPPNPIADATQPTELYAIRLANSPYMLDVDVRAQADMESHAKASGLVFLGFVERVVFDDVGEVGFVGRFMRGQQTLEPAEPARSWQSALRQLADTLAPGADVEIDPMDPEVSCARIVEAVGHRIDALEAECYSERCSDES